jgi:hypothetical protein
VDSHPDAALGCGLMMVAGAVIGLILAMALFVLVWHVGQALA